MYLGISPGDLGPCHKNVRISSVSYHVLQHLKAADEMRDDVPGGSLDTHSPWTGSPSQWHAIVTLSAISLKTPVSAWTPVHSRSHSESKRPVSPRPATPGIRREVGKMRRRRRRREESREPGHFVATGLQSTWLDTLAFVIFTSQAEN